MKSGGAMKERSQKQVGEEEEKHREEDLAVVQDST